MEAAQRPITAVVGALQRFVRVPRLRLLQILTDADLRIVMLEHIAGEEHHRANESPFLILEAPTELDSSGWNARAEELRLELAESSGGACVIEPKGRASRSDFSDWSADLREFGLTLGQALAALPEHIPGLVVVLAPLRVQAQARWASDLIALLKPPELGRVRFIVLDIDAPVSKVVSDHLQESAMSVDARLGALEARDALQSQIESIAAAPAGAAGPRALGAAGPRVAPPPHRGTTDEDDPGRDLRALLSGSAAAYQHNEPTEAVGLQKQAIERCRAAGSHREAIILELALASAVLQLGRTRSALKIIDEVGAHSEERAFHDLTVEALFTRGMAFAIEKKHEEAALAYNEAGSRAHKHGFVGLAIEAYRVCGELLVRRERIDTAIAAWKRALEIAEESEPDLVAQSSAPQMARSLASLCRKHGKGELAAVLEAKADEFEDPAARPVEAEAEPAPEPIFAPPAEPIILPTAPAQPSCPPPERKSLRDTLEMVAVELPRGDESCNRQWAEEVAAMSTVAVPAVQIPTIPTYDELFGDVDTSQLKRDPRLAPTQPMEAITDTSYRDPRYVRTLEVRAVDIPRGFPMLPVLEQEKPMSLSATQAFKVKKPEKPEKRPPRKVHVTERPSMELPAVVLPGEDEPKGGS